MKTISDYTIYCTEKQTKKALELGAPIEYANNDYNESLSPIEKGLYAIIPTAEQMIGWLEEQGLLFQTTKIGTLVLKEDNRVLKVCTGSRKEATLAAIDKALEYLVDNKLLK